jgi:hypothetical protein
MPYPIHEVRGDPGGRRSVSINVTVALTALAVMSDATRSACAACRLASPATGEPGQAARNRPAAATGRASGGHRPRCAGRSFHPAASRSPRSRASVLRRDPVTFQRGATPDPGGPSRPVCIRGPDQRLTTELCRGHEPIGLAHISESSTAPRLTNCRGALVTRLPGATGAVGDCGPRGGPRATVADRASAPPTNATPERARAGTYERPVISLGGQPVRSGGRENGLNQGSFAKDLGAVRVTRQS